MSGIAGIWEFNSSVNNTARVKQMLNIIAHRGLQSEDTWSLNSNSLSLGNRRQSGIDISDKPEQSINLAERYTLTFDGALHNSVELREELKGKGYTFHTNTDTEVLLAAYHEFKEDCLLHLDGMFAFALWDNETKTLFCARDRVGQKPFFYYYTKSSSFRFASEMKSLWADGVTKELNNKLLFYYLTYNVIENPFDKSETFYKNISRLEAAHYLLIRGDGTMVKKKYWDIDLSVKSDLSIEKATERFRELFFQSVERRLRSDVPVGSSLSGGVDSSSIVCSSPQVMKENYRALHTFSARFNDASLDEGKFMADVASTVEIQRHDVWVDEQVLLNDLDKIIIHQEEPLLDASPLAQWCVMRMAKEKNVSVLLDGQGADSVLGGASVFFRSYFRELLLTDKKKFKQELSAYKKVRGNEFPADMNFRLQSRYAFLFRGIGNLRRRFTTPDYLSFLHPEFIDAFRNEPPPFETFNTLNEALKYSITVYGLEKLLRYADRNSMAFSREVRFPFLNHELIEFVLSLPASYKIRDGWTKFILRSSMQPFLPPSVAWRTDKLGYQPPLQNWLKQGKVAERVKDSASLLFSKHVLRANTAIAGREWSLLMAAAML